MDGQINKFNFGNHAVYPFTVLVKFVKIKFMLNDQVYHQRSTDTDRQPRNIDQRKDLIPLEISQG